MKSIRCLGQMELAGIGFSGAVCEAQASVMQAKLAALEKEAFQLAGRNFCLSSPDDVSKVNNMNGSNIWHVVSVYCIYFIFIEIIMMLTMSK